MVTTRANDFPHAFLLIAALAVMVIGFGLAGPAAARTAPPAAIERMIVDEAARQGIPASLILAVAKVESNFKARAESSAGARGVMQIMPKTARDLYGVPADDLWDPQLNIQLGVDYLKSLIKQYGGRWDLALSHYNGGSRVGTPPNARVIPATRGYVDAVLAWQRRYERTDTMVAMAGAVESRDRIASRFSGNRTVEYWMFDDPTVVKDWRHYLKVADYWLGKGDAKPAAATAPAEGPQPSAASVAEAEESGPSEVTAAPARASDELARRFTARRLQFRDQLSSGTRPWAPARSGFSVYAPRG